MGSRTIALVDVERGDLIRVIGWERGWIVTGLDRIANTVTLEFWENDGKGYRNMVFHANSVIGHLREYKSGCYRTMWTRYGEK